MANKKRRALELETQAGQAKRKRYKLKKTAWIPLTVIALVMVLIIIWVILAMTWVKPDPINGEPASDIRGYYAPNQTFRGGEEMSGAVISDVAVKKSRKDTVITIEFSQRGANDPTRQSKAAQVPFYQLSVSDSPRRLALYLEGVTTTSFFASTQWQDHPLLAGLFVSQATSVDNPTLYFHLSDDVAYKVKQSGGTLSIHLRPLEKDAAPTRYFVTLNAASEYTFMRDVRALGLEPTLCSNGQSVVLISQPYKTKEEAENFAGEIQETVDLILAGKSAKVIALAGNELPEFLLSTVETEIAARPVAKKDGQSVEAQVVDIGSRLLTLTPGGKTALGAMQMRSVEPTDGAQGETYEILFTIDEDGAKDQLVDLTFNKIRYAEFTPQADKLVFWDEPAESNEATLYLYDLAEDQLLDLSAQGMGNDIVSCTLAPDGSMLYAVCVASQDEDAAVSYSIRSYDMASGRIETVLELENEATVIGADAKGSLFYNDPSFGNDGAVYRLNLSTMDVTQVAVGTRFILSPDGSYLAVTGSGSLSAAQDSLRVYSLKDGAEIVRLPGVKMMDMHFSADSGQLVVLSDTEEVTEEFRYDVLLIDLETRESWTLFQVPMIDFAFAQGENRIALNDYYNHQGDYVPVIYSVALE